ncbi:kinase-like protein [Martensiomyces pterosporus]|nr:kinase-like protein [Martensiomyces pterosporus]
MVFHIISRHVDETLENENWFTLNKRIKADLIVLCQERALPTDGSKSQLIHELMEWKIKAKPVPVPSKPHLEQLNTREAILLYNSDGRGSSDSADFSDEIPSEKLVRGDKIGSGGFKDCYRGEYQGNAVAIGVVRITDFSSRDFDEIRHEISVLKQLRHENIVKFIGVSSGVGNQLSIVTELCENGDLYDFMRKIPKPSFGQLMMFMHDIALGVSYLHTRRPSVIHRDLKSMNVLISSDNRAKINDFGLARIRPRMNATAHTACGTPNWQAPEIWAPRPSYTEKVDVYACGLIFWEILQWGVEPYPYHDMNQHQLYAQVRDHGFRPSLSRLQKYPRALLALIQNMWAQKPSDRPPMTQVVERLLEYLS